MSFRDAPWLIRFFVVFLVLAVGSAVAISVFGYEFGTVDYWERHGVLLLLGLSCFPRLTLLISSIATGGVLWWLGWLFAPRILVAILATLAYFQTNPILVVLAWLSAIGGETTEKHWAQRYSAKVIQPRRDPDPR